MPEGHTFFAWHRQHRTICMLFYRLLSSSRPSQYALGKRPFCAHSVCTVSFLWLLETILLSSDALFSWTYFSLLLPMFVQPYLPDFMHFFADLRTSEEVLFHTRFAVLLNRVGSPLFVLLTHVDIVFLDAPRSFDAARIEYLPAIMPATLTNCSSYIIGGTPPLFFVALQRTLFGGNIKFP